jgi:hypothetical protein
MATRSAPPPGDERETKVLMLTAADGLDDVVEGSARRRRLPLPLDEKLVASHSRLARRAPRPPGRPAQRRHRLDLARRASARGTEFRPDAEGVRRSRLMWPTAPPSRETLLQQVWDEHADVHQPVRMTVMTLRGASSASRRARDGHGAGYRASDARPTVAAYDPAPCRVRARQRRLRRQPHPGRNNVTADHERGVRPGRRQAARSSARWPTTPCTACASVRDRPAAMTLLSFRAGWSPVASRPLQQITATAARLADTLRAHRSGGSARAQGWPTPSSPMLERLRAPSPASGACGQRVAQVRR